MGEIEGVRFREELVGFVLNESSYRSIRSRLDCKSGQEPR